MPVVDDLLGRAESTFLDLDLTKNLAIGVAAAAGLGALAVLLFVKSIVTKILTAVVLLAVGLAVWLQRDSLIDCAEKVRAGIVDQQTGVPEKVTCRFFGQDVSIDVPN
jgi:hypothetical protein